MISVIMPVYNSEKYLHACIDSVLAQTYKDFELLLVDDGSTDRSGEICDEYEKNDPRVKVFHIENSGSSAARNYGIDRAKGDYLGFIDSDDEIEPDMYEFLYELLKKENADMSMCGLADIYGGKVVNPVSEPVYKVMNDSESIRTVFEAKLTSVTPVNKLYKKELFEGVRYPVGEDSGEDASIIIDLLSKCKKTVLDNTQKYKYIHRVGSITTRQFTPKDLSVIRAYKKNCGLIEANYPELMDVAGMRLCWAYFFVLDKLLLCENRKKYKKIEKKLVAFLRKNTGFILKDKSFNSTRKTAMLALKVSVTAYKGFVLLKESKKVKQ